MRLKRKSRMIFLAKSNAASSVSGINCLYLNFPRL